MCFSYCMLPHFYLVQVFPPLTFSKWAGRTEVFWNHQDHEKTSQNRWCFFSTNTADGKFFLKSISAADSWSFTQIPSNSYRSTQKLYLIFRASSVCQCKASRCVKCSPKWGVVCVLQSSRVRPADEIFNDIYSRSCISLWPQKWALLGQCQFFPVKLPRFLSSLATNLARTAETKGFMLGTYVRQGLCNEIQNSNMYTL